MQEVITSRQNPLIIWTASLSEKKYRDQFRLFLLEGKKLHEEAEANGIELSEIFVTEKYYQEHRTALDRSYGEQAKLVNEQKDKARLVICSEGAFSKISSEKSPEGIISTAKYLDKVHKFTTIYNAQEECGVGSRFILCDVRDPGNLGTAIRSAAAFGIDELILSGCADLYHPKTVRGAMGALFRQKITVVADPVASVRALIAAGKKVYAAALTESAELLDRLPDTDVCFAVGNEGHGLSKEFISACTGAVLIPMLPGSESLNAAVAASILMYCRGRKILK